MDGDLFVDQDGLDVVGAQRKFFKDTVNRHLGSDGLVLDHRGTVEVNGDSSEHVSAMLAASSM